MAVLDDYEVLEHIREDLDLTDRSQDDVLNRLFTKVCDHFKFEYNVEEIESRYGFIIEDCVIKRFNRRGAEGASSETVEGHSVTYLEEQNEFAPWDARLREELKTSKAKSGSVLFL